MFLGPTETKAPEGLALLRDAPWPEWVKAEIVAAHERFGRTDVLNTKVVEPCAIIHGGKCVNGVPDLSRVWWAMLRDYYVWEASALAGHRSTHRLQAQAKKRYGGQHWHYPVYDPEGPNPLGACWFYDDGPPPIE